MMPPKIQWTRTRLYKIDLSYADPGSSYSSCYDHYVTKTYWFDTKEQAERNAKVGDTIRKVTVNEEYSVETAPTIIIKKYE